MVSLLVGTYIYIYYMLYIACFTRHSLINTAGVLRMLGIVWLLTPATLATYTTVPASFVQSVGSKLAHVQMQGTDNSNVLSMALTSYKYKLNQIITVNARAYEIVRLSLQFAGVKLAQVSSDPIRSATSSLLVKYFLITWLIDPKLTVVKRPCKPASCKRPCNCEQVCQRNTSSWTI